MSDDDMLASVELVKGFLRVGQFTWPEWLGFDDEARAVILQASEELEGERAALLAVAITTEDGPARALSLSDGGDMLVGNALARAVSRCARSVPQ